MTIKNWISASGSWETATDWSPLGVPGTADDVVFDIAVMGPVNHSLGGPYNLITAGTKTVDFANSISVIGEVVNFAGSIAAQSVSIDDGGFLGFSYTYPNTPVLYAGTLDVGNDLAQGGTETGGTFDVSEVFFEDANGIIDGRGTRAALGEVNFGTWANTGALIVEGPSAALFLYDGTLDCGPAGVLVMSGATLSDSGATIASAITLASGTLIGTSATLASGLVLDGTANVIGGGNFTLGSIMDGTIAGGFTAAASALGGVIQLRGSNSFSAGVTLTSGTLELTGAGAAGSGSIVFAPSATATLRIDAGAVPSNAIEGFALGDTITLPFIPYDDTLSLNESGGIVTISDGQAIAAQLTFAGSDTILPPLLELDGSGKTELIAASPTVVQASGLAGDWSSTAVWASGLVPSAANDVYLAATGAGAISVAGTQSAANVVDSSGANLTIGLGSTLSVAGDVVVDGGTLTVLGQLADSALVLNAATLALQSTPPSTYYIYGPNIRNYGLVAMHGGEIDLTGTASAALSLSELGGGPVVLNGAGPGYLSANLLQPGGIFTTGNVSVSGATSTVFVESGTLYDASSASTVVFAGGANAELVMPASESYGYVSDITAAVAPGGGNDTVLANSGMGTIFGGSGSMTFIGVASSLETDPDANIFPVAPYAALVVGGSGSLMAYGAMNTQNPGFYRYGTNMFFGGSGGSNILVSGDGASTLVGGGTGDQLYANGLANVILVAGAGNETLTGAGSTGGNVFYGGSGNDVIVAGGGNDTVVAGAGAQTIFGGNSNPTLIVAGSGQDVILAGASTDYVEAGSGSALVFAGANDIFAAINGQAGGELAIVGFNPSNDFIRLQGYASTAVATALAGATIAGGSTQLTLPDATKLVLYGVTNLTAASFI